MTRKERYASDPDYRARISAQRKARYETLRREEPERFGQMRAKLRKGPRVYPPLPEEKACTRCGVAKPATTEFFSPRKQGRHGLNSWCKECQAEAARLKRQTDPEYRARHIAAVTASTKKRKEKDPEAWRQAHNRQGREIKRRYRADPEKNERLLAKDREWRKANWSRVRNYKHKSGALGAKHSMDYYAKKTRSVPIWADQEAIGKIYEEAAKLTLITGIEHQVDHIVPIRHRLVSGLHWEGNLQILPASVNKRKSNKLSHL